MKKILLILFTLFYSQLIFGQTENDTINIEKKSNQYESLPIYAVAQEMPIFRYKRNDDESMKSFIQYTTDSLRISSSECSGKIVVKFVVEPDGTTSNVKILKGIENCPNIDNEIKRFILTMPNWIPGKQRGEASRVSVNMPLNIDPNN